MDWSTKAVKEYRQSKKCRFQNSEYYFTNGIGIPMIRSSKLTGALIDGRLFDQSIVGVFPKDESWINYLLGFFNSSICTELINAINPSTNNSANYIKKIPFIVPADNLKNKVEKLVESILSKLKSGDINIESEKILLDELFDNLYLKDIGAEKDQYNKSNPAVKQLDILDLLYQYSDNTNIENCALLISEPENDYDEVPISDQT